MTYTTLLFYVDRLSDEFNFKCVTVNYFRIFKEIFTGDFLFCLTTELHAVYVFIETNGTFPL